MSKYIGLKVVVMATMVATIASGHSAQAATVSKYTSVPGAGACQLSVPTIDTAVRPRATGYRNEGTANAFVICSFATVRNNTPTKLQAQMFSFDSKDHTFNCTFASTLSYGDPLFLVKSITTTADNGQVDTEVVTADGLIQRYNTMTCLLPPGVAINGIQTTFNDDIGT